MQNLSCKLDRKSLKAALGHAARVVERRNTIPILGHVLFEICRDQVRVTGTDLDLQLVQELPAATEGEGRIALPLQPLKDAVSKFKGETVQIDDMGGCKASLTCLTTNARVMLPTREVDEFPTIVRGDMLSTFQMPSEQFAGAIAAMLSFVSTEETRYYLQGAFLHAVCDNPGPRTEEHERLCGELAELRALEQGALDEAGPSEDRSDEQQEKLEAVCERVAAQSADISARVAILEADRCKPDTLRFAATDGHRMGRYTLPLPEGAESLADGIIPTKTCKLFAAIAGKKPEWLDVRVAASRSKIEIRYGRFTILAKLIDGTFPDYTRVIPSMNEHSLTVPAGAFADAVAGVTAVASERTRAVAVSVSAEEGVILSCSSPEAGRAVAVFEGAEISEGAALAIGFNAKYVGDMLALFAAEAPVTFHLADPAVPVLIESPTRPELLTVLMPMRVDGSVMTRADVEAMNMNPWQALQHKAGDIATMGTHGWVADQYIRPAIAFLVDGGQPRFVARQMVKVELALAAGKAKVADRARAMIQAYERQPYYDGFKALAELPAFRASLAEYRERDLAPDLPPQDPAMDPADETEAVDDYVTGSSPPSPAEPENVAAQGQVADEFRNPFAAEPVKVLTVTGQAVYVALHEWENPVQSVLQRYNRDGSLFGERTILRVNIERRVFARNRGDKPIPSQKGNASIPAVGGDVAERLARLECMIAGIAQPRRPKRSPAHVRAIMAYMKLRGTRGQIRNLCETIKVANDQCYASDLRWRNALEEQNAAECKAAKLDAAIECRNIALADVERLRVRCEALERLHVDSAVLDAPADKPAIILPIRTAGARQEAGAN